MFYTHVCGLPIEQLLERERMKEEERERDIYCMYAVTHTYVDSTIKRQWKNAPALDGHLSEKQTNCGDKSRIIIL